MTSLSEFEPFQGNLFVIRNESQLFTSQLVELKKLCAVKTALTHLFMHGDFHLT